MGLSREATHSGCGNHAHMPGACSMPGVAPSPGCLRKQPVHPTSSVRQPRPAGEGTAPALGPLAAPRSWDSKENQCPFQSPSPNSGRSPCVCSRRWHVCGLAGRPSKQQGLEDQTRKSVTARANRELVGKGQAGLDEPPLRTPPHAHSSECSWLEPFHLGKATSVCAIITATGTDFWFPLPELLWEVE